MLSPIKINKNQNKELAAQMHRYQKHIDKLEERKAAPLAPRQNGLLNCLIIDIDGTLAKRSNRGVYDFNKSIDDILVEPVNNIIGATLDTTISPQIILITGREECHREVTEAWLKKHNVYYDELYMRRTGDRRRSDIVKEEIYLANVRGKWNVWFCIDDRIQDVLMYRSHGLYVLVADNSRE